jgi:hypothetical protein
MRVLLSILCLVAIVGCDKPTSSPVAPATMPSPTAATMPATRPTASFMKINGLTLMFPPARLKLEADGAHLTALLFSDDPPEAIKDDYQGNSYYLPMPLEIDDVKDLASASWSRRAQSSDRDDSPYGISLNGRKVHLQPYDARAQFVAGETTSVHLSGQFLMFDDRDRHALPQIVSVWAELPVEVHAEGTGKK